MDAGPRQNLFFARNLHTVNAVHVCFLSFVAFVFCCPIQAQIYDTNNPVVQTFAGSGFSGYVDGQGTQTMFFFPRAIGVDSVGNLLVVDGNGSAPDSQRMRTISPSGYVSTLYLQGSLYPNPNSMAIDHFDNINLVTDASPTWLTVSLSTKYVSVYGLTGWGNTGGICVDSSNIVYISNPRGNRIYRWINNGLEVFAGSGNSGSINGNGIFTSFNNPSALAVDSADNVYVWDSGNRLIRRISQNRDVVTITGNLGSASADGVGTNAAFSNVNSMCADGLGNLYVACASCIRKISATTNVTTLAGSFTQTGYTDGIGSDARFNGLAGVCFSQGSLFVTDKNNQRIRSLTFKPTEQLVSGPDLGLGTFAGLKISGIVGRTYRIESSTDMNTWNPETTILLNSSPFLWIDSTELSPEKFYRAFLLP